MGNSIKESFQNSQILVVSIQKSGGNALLYLKNQGRNTVMIRRILLCFTYRTGQMTTSVLRPAPAVSWTYPSSFLDAGIDALFYTLDATNVKAVQAQAEYIEIEGRSQSELVEF
jgi:hypothetical protein